MAFIAYDQDQPRGNILRISTIHPEALRAHLDLYRTLVHGPSPLSRTRREMIAVAVSQLNGCHY
ncbi:MAG TPA: carboxymuconolactone decarboxylase family protein [Gemmatimonadota bacterium]|nr:carboxymuconolactone decarboxylase family protein [Gemmatimonadota bacterium]